VRCIRFEEGQSEFKIPGTSFTARPGDRIALSAYHSHHDEEIFEDPYTFKPLRFLSDDPERETKQFFKGGERQPYAFMPWGAGAGKCP